MFKFGLGQVVKIKTKEIVFDKKGKPIENKWFIWCCEETPNGDQYKLSNIFEMITEIANEDDLELISDNDPPRYADIGIIDQIFGD